MFISTSRGWPLTRWYRLFFVLGLLYSFLIFLTGQQKWNVETSLKDISPTLSSNRVASKVIDDIGHYAEKRLVVLFQSDNRQALHQARLHFEAELANVTGWRIIDEAYIQQSLVSTLTPYRFNVLTLGQYNALANDSADSIVAKEYRRLFRLSADIRLLAFEQDPIGWFSGYLFSLAEKGAANSELAQTEPPYISTITLELTQPALTMQAQASLLASINAIESQVLSNFDVSIIKSGILLFAADAARQSKADIQFIAVSSSLAILALMILVFRSIKPIAIAAISIVTGIAFASALSHVLFGSVHILTIVFGASLIGIVVDYSLHYASHRTAPLAPSESSHRQLSKAMLLSMVTSFIGFGALAFSGVDALKKVAVFSCSGLVMAWLAVMSLGPWLSTARQAERSQKLIDRFLPRPLSRPKHCLIVMLLCSIAGGGYLLWTGVTANDDPRLFFKPSSQLLQQERTVTKHTNSVENNQFLIVMGRSVDEVYEKLESLDQYASERGIQLLSVRDYLPSPSVQQENYQLQEKLYASDGIVQSLMMRLGVSGEQIQELQNLYRRQAGQILLPADFQMQMPWLPPLWGELESEYFATVIFEKSNNLALIKPWVAQNQEAMSINVTGLAAGALQQQRQSATALLLIAYVLVALLLLFYFRSLVKLSYLIIPITATLAVLVILPLIGQPITIFHLMALFLVLGLGMDYIIFAMEMTSEYRVTMRAILLSGVTSLLSFGLLSFSSMPVVQAFGSTVLLGNSINLIATLFLFGRQQGGKEKI